MKKQKRRLRPQLVDSQRRLGTRQRREQSRAAHRAQRQSRRDAKLRKWNGLKPTIRQRLRAWAKERFPHISQLAIDRLIGRLR